MGGVRPMFLVRRRGLRLLDTRAGDDRHRTPFSSFETLNRPDDAPRTVPVALSATRSSAEAQARELERADRRLINPFWNGNCLRGKTSLAEEEFLARLTALGLPLPSRGSSSNRNWWRWWENNAHDWPDDLFHAVWDLLDGFRLYDVAEIEMEEPPTPGLASG